MSVHIHGPEKIEVLGEVGLIEYKLKGPQLVNASKFRHRVASAKIAYYYDETYLCITTACGKQSSRSSEGSRFFPCTLRRKPCKTCYPDESKG